VKNSEDILTYDEMLEKAKGIHPRAKLTKTSEFGNWIIMIPTEFKVSEQLSESYRGTPAWDLHESYESNYGTDLLRWQYKNGYTDEILDKVADRWNTQIEASNLQNSFLAKLNEESGVSIEDWSKASTSEVEKYFQNEKLAADLADEGIKAIYKKMNAKWSESIV
jgi:hypothetical protein